ncbi:hypothetical protein [Bacillus cereus group sp. BceL302]|uniref:hypothetical protein n=1 Tax=Bacillus cereus group sp. BceL302 TaxID=3444983 RepID=UPI00330A6F9D|nr:hypothetical protein [Bacillus sp. (in: firmicutes)]HDR8408842.1 hypothetical protein [Bacillus cereus]
MTNNVENKIRLHMDNGMKYDLPIHINDFMREIHNAAEIVINSFFTFEGDIYINPIHISSIEIIS